VNSHEITLALRQRATDEGFDAVGIAAADALQRDRARLEDWLGREGHATMHWLARDPAKRADPRLLLPGCRSVVVLAANYGPGADGHDASLARVARYARGRDYHKVMAPGLKRLAAWLDGETGGTSRGFVDTGPVLERGWAERAGVGWIGKNANLLTREMGSWLMLGEILTTTELAPSPGPHAEFCGTCTACLDACPTDAIVQDGWVDSKLCISYWTIEHRGPVPEERRAGIGDWIFGCDVCQEVCPWNESFGHEADPFTAREDLQGLAPLAILAMDEATFRARYSGTALMRAKWEGMRRNACVVLGNRRQANAVEPLGRVLADDPDSVLRGHAAWALGAIGGPAAELLLSRAAAREEEAGVLVEIASARRKTDGSARDR